MSDKSPRQGMSKKSGMSIKYIRAEKGAKNDPAPMIDTHPAKKR